VAVRDGKWEEFRIGDIFEVLPTKTREILHYSNNGLIPFVASGANNNGIEKYVDSHDEELDKGNCVTVSSLDCSSFYQKKDFLGRGHGAVNRLYHEKMNKNIGLFLSVLIKKLGAKYNYGRQCFLEKLKNETIFLPVKNSQPDWEYMDDYIKNKRKKMNL
jgi:hypothetical protein